MKENKLSKKKKTSIVIILIILMFLIFDMLAYCVGGSSLIFGKFIFSSKGTVQNVDIIKDNPISSLDESSLLADTSTEKNYFSVEVNSTSSYENKVLQTHVVNPANNYYSCFIEFKVDDTILYTSDKLKPNQFMDKIPMNLSLKKGNYDMDIVYNILDEKSKVIGVQIVATKLNVRG